MVLSPVRSLAALSIIFDPPVLLGRHLVGVDMAFNTAADWVEGEKDPRLNGPGHAISPHNEKTLTEEKHVEEDVTSEPNLVYDDVDEEPELHARTYLALGAMFLFFFVDVFALQGPPAVVGGRCACRAS